MSNALLSSKIIINEEPPRIRSVVAQPTAVLGMVGITERGPVGSAALYSSFEEWTTVFGGATTESLDTYAAVTGFFEEGGQFLYFVRTVHYTDISDANSQTAVKAYVDISTSASAPTSASTTGSNTAPFLMANGQTLIVDVDGAGAVTATFNATAGSRTSGNTEPFALTDGNTLLVAVDGGGAQTVTFDTAEFGAIGAATALEVAAVINAEVTGVSATVSVGAVVITSDTLGTSSSVEITGGTDAAALAFPGGAGAGTGDISGAGSIADITAVTVAEIKAGVEATIAGLTINDVGGAAQIVSNTTGAASTIQVTAASTADAVLGFTNATFSGTTGAATPTLRVSGRYFGAYANDFSVVVGAATNGEASQFNLDVVESGVTVESFANVSMDDTSAAFVETAVNASPGVGSQYLAATDLDAGLGTPTLDRPANGTYNVNTTIAGDSGLAGLADTDFIGNSAGETGLRAFDTVDALTILAIPARPTAAVANAMITYAEVTRNGRMLAIIDCPAQQTAAEVITYVDTTASIGGLSEYGAIYWPHVEILNPSVETFGADPLYVPPSGHIAGVMARTDSSAPGGVYRQPAGVVNGQLRTIIGFEKLPGKAAPESFDENKRDLVFPKLINPLDNQGGVRNIDGARTLKADSNFPSVGERRGVSFIEFSLKNALEFVRHQNNTPELREEVERIVENFLLNQMRFGAFRSRNPSEAFFVDFGPGLNPDAVVFAGQLIGRIGLATNKPAEFVILNFTQDTRALEQALSQ